MKKAPVQFPVDERDFCDELIMDAPQLLHDRLFISARPVTEDTPRYYALNRAGTVAQTSGLFVVRRNADTCMNNLHCVIAGSGELSFRGQTYLLRAGQIFLLCAGEPHLYRSDPTHPFGLTWIEYLGGGSEQLTRHIIDRAGTPVLAGTAFTETALSIMTILDRVEDDAGYEPSIELYSILYRLSRTVGPDAESKLSRHAFYGRIRALDSFIEANLDRNITVEELAEHAGYSKHYFIRKFNEVHGVGPHAYIMRHRINQSKFLLSDADESLDSIAHKLGFCNASHYIRRFRAQENISPAEYRRQNGLHYHDRF